MSDTVTGGNVGDGLLRVVCTECGHEHTISDRVTEPDGSGGDAIVCPKCKMNGFVPRQFLFDDTDEPDTDGVMGVITDALSDNDTTTTNDNLE